MDTANSGEATAATIELIRQQILAAGLTPGTPEAAAWTAERGDEYGFWAEQAALAHRAVRPGQEHGQDADKEAPDKEEQ